MKKTIFLTGFPGFISKHLLIQLFNDHATIEKAYLLVHHSQIIQAQKLLASVIREGNIPITKFEIIEGDITKPNLDLAFTFEREQITHVFHLAALYDLAVKEDLAYTINVDGTKNVNAFTRTLPHLQQYIYFSTAYVSGIQGGIVYEKDLIASQVFRNHYEKTKYMAEIEVQNNMESVPTTIIRPGIVVGHSESGETAKFDGPYFLLQFFYKFRWFPIPYIGKSSVHTNFVPVDYIAKSVSFMMSNEGAYNKVFHLVNPHSFNVEEAYKLLLFSFLNKEPKGRIPLSIVKQLLKIKPVRQWIGVEKEVLDYFQLHPYYDSTNTINLLKDTNISPPSFPTIVPHLVRYFENNKLDESKKIRIV